MRPNTNAGSASAAISKRARDRKPRSIRRRRPPEPPHKGELDQTAYELVRIDEIRSRAALYKLRFEQLNDQLLDRAMLRVELEQLFKAIRTIIESYPMTEREKSDCLCNLVPVDEILDRVARKQNTDVSGFDGHGHAADRELGRQVFAA